MVKLFHYPTHNSWSWRVTIFEDTAWKKNGLMEKLLSSFKDSLKVHAVKVNEDYLSKTDLVKSSRPWLISSDTRKHILSFKRCFKGFIFFFQELFLKRQTNPYPSPSSMIQGPVVQSKIQLTRNITGLWFQFNYELLEVFPKTLHFICLIILGLT